MGLNDSLFWPAARIWRIRPRLDLGSVLASALRYCLSRAAEKQKERGDVWTFAINRPPLRGLSPWPTMKSRSLLSAESHRGCLATDFSGKDERGLAHSKSFAHSCQRLGARQAN